MPARGDLRPRELTGPIGAVDGKLGSFFRIREQLHGCVNPELLALLVVYAVVKTPRLGPGILVLAWDLNAKLHVLCQCTKIRRNRNKAHALGLLAEKQAAFRAVGR